MSDQPPRSDVAFGEEVVAKFYLKELLMKLMDFVLIYMIVALVLFVSQTTLAAWLCNKRAVPVKENEFRTIVLASAGWIIMIPFICTFRVVSSLRLAMTSGCAAIQPDMELRLSAKQEPTNAKP